MRIIIEDSRPSITVRDFDDTEHIIVLDERVCHALIDGAQEALTYFGEEEN